MAMRGVQPWVIQAMGNWQSGVYKAYIEKSVEYMNEVADALRGRSEEITTKELDAARRVTSGVPEWFDEFSF